MSNNYNTQLLTELQKAGLSKDEAEELASLLNDEWYYRIQITPDVWTRAQRFESVALTRALIARTDVPGCTLLDIGTMEGLIPILACAAGAKSVTAYDRLTDRERRVYLIQKLYRRDFLHDTGSSLQQFRSKNMQRAFDIVVFSGVFYHRFDPFGGLVAAYSFCRPGGIFILETSAIVRDDCALHFKRKR